ncbi:threonine ammonia-lyase [Pseudomonas alloputida]|uniref:threonine ammonia-lyase n=1 Tax=Pseudomonas TaxID=286 RepID=UPI003EEB1BDA
MKNQFIESERLDLSTAWSEMGKGLGSTLIVNTPIFSVPTLAKAAGISKVYVKAEYLQAGGSFKVRGAMLKLKYLMANGRKPIVYAASAGNHGIGLALAARELGFTAIIYVPTSTPEVKRQKIRSAGAILEVTGSHYDESEDLAIAACREANGEYISSFDDEFIICGNGGSLALEIESCLQNQLIEFDVLVPIGGGGLASGIGAYLKGKVKNIYGVEPANNCAMAKSLAKGQFDTEYSGTSSIADGLAGAISKNTYALCSKNLTGVLTVSESNISNAIAWAYQNLGIVVEGSAAVTIAALLSGKQEFSEKVCLVLTGSNIDQASLKQALQV